MFHPTKLPHTLAWGSWSLGLAGTGAYCSTYYMVQAMEYYQVLVLPTIYYYIYGPGYGILVTSRIVLFSPYDLRAVTYTHVHATSITP